MASPTTEISSCGATAVDLAPVRVKGSKSVLHAFVAMPHADGRGVSLVLDAPLLPGESVAMCANRPIGGRVDKPTVNDLS